MEKFLPVQISSRQAARVACTQLPSSSLEQECECEKAGYTKVHTHKTNNTIESIAIINTIPSKKMSEYTFLPGISLPLFSDFLSEVPTDSDIEKGSTRQRLPLKKHHSFQSGLNGAKEMKPTRKRSSFKDPTSFQAAEPMRNSKQRRRGVPKSDNLYLIARNRLRVAFKTSLSSVEESDVALEVTIRIANHKK